MYSISRGGLTMKVVWLLVAALSIVALTQLSFAPVAQADDESTYDTTEEESDDDSSVESEEEEETSSEDY